jgi:hypothetical protein
MRLLLSAVVAVGSLLFAIAAVAQSTTSAPAVPVNPAPAVPVASGKRFDLPPKKWTGLSCL